MMSGRVSENAFDVFAKHIPIFVGMLSDSIYSGGGMAYA